MILRRITEHVKSQNWTAVGIDFVIVVVGVFVGIQVSNWNEERRTRMVEHDLINRLHEETQELLELQDESLAELMKMVDVQLAINPVLFSQEPERPLGIYECEAIASSHILRRPPDEIPTLDEMLATGRFEVLRNQTIKQQLSNYILVRERWRGRYVESASGFFRLHSRHPDLITVGRAPLDTGYDGRWDFLSGEGFRWDVQCDIEKMRETPGFLNEYVDNLGRSSSLVESYQERSEVLAALAAALASEMRFKPRSGQSD
jgi:hypothetical protein